MLSWLSVILQSEATLSPLASRFLTRALLLFYLTVSTSSQLMLVAQLPGVNGEALPDNEPAPMYDPGQGMIRLDVEVLDKSGDPVAGLKEQDFTFQDNDKPGTIA